MSATSAGLAVGRPRAGVPDRIRLSPEEGWATVALVAVLAWTVGWAIDDPRYVLGDNELTDFLPWVGLGGVVAGFVGAKLGWPRWIAHLAGAAVAALVIPVVVGSMVVEVPSDVVAQFRATAESSRIAWYDLVIAGSSRTQEFGHYLLGLGILCWATGQFAAYAVFGHRRPLDAIVVVGLVLLANMSVTANDQLRQLVVFSLAALFLLTRAHAFDEQAAWLRRRIGDPADVRALYLRGGSVFILTAVVGSLLLTSMASSAPLAGIWSNMPGFLIELGQRFERLLPLGGATRSLGVTFGDDLTISSFWSSDGSLALTIRLPEDEKELFYWRAVAYDTVKFGGWSMSAKSEVDRAAGEPLLAGMFDEPPMQGHREVVFTVERNGYFGPKIVSPQTPVEASVAGVVTAVGAGQFGSIALDGNPATYQVTALVPIRGDDDPNGLTQNRLRAAGRGYPPAILPYIEVPDGVVGPQALALLDEVRGRARADNPYDLARATESYLRSPRFRYDTNIQHLDCAGQSTVECFARYRQGFCEWYATTMAVLLREAGIPARMVEGFLPGEPDASGVVRLYNSGAHAWVEVWFPGYGWYRFDPTGGISVARDTPLPPGAEVSPGPSVSIPPPSFRGEIGGGATEDEGPDEGGAAPPGPSAPVAFSLIAVLLAAVVGGLALVAWMRGPRGEVGPDAMWRGIGRIAARFGFGPRPTQTVYEYAGALGDVLPGSKPELETVARAKVEVAYGRGILSSERLGALRDANRRLRVSLLRLAFRRAERRARRRR